MLSRLDVYREPADTALTPPKARGGMLHISTLAVWVAYVAIATVEYMNSPDISSVMIVPSSLFVNNYLDFEFVDSGIQSAPAFFYGKRDNLAACDHVATRTPIGQPTPLCPYVLGASPCGVDGDGNDVLFPQGVAYFYSITNQSLVDSIFDYNFNPMYVLRAPNSDAYLKESWVDVVPVNHQMPEVRGKPGLLVLSVAEVVVTIKHTIYPNGKNSTRLMGTNVNVKWVTVNLTGVERDGWEKCSKGIFPHYDETSGNFSIAFSDLTPSGRPQLTNQTRRGAFMGLGVVILMSKDTTVVERITDGRPGIYSFLGSLGGAFGFLMGASRIVYKILDTTASLPIVKSCKSRWRSRVCWLCNNFTRSRGIHTPRKPESLHVCVRPEAALAADVHVAEEKPPEATELPVEASENRNVSV